MSTPPINVFIYQRSAEVQNQLVLFAKTTVPGNSTTPEADGWRGYVRQHGTPPVGEYIVFANGHHYKVNTSQTLTVADLGSAS